MPRAWADFLAQAGANGQVSGERLEDTARVNGIGTADKGQDGRCSEQRRPTAAILGHR